MKDTQLNHNHLKQIFIIRHAKSSWSYPGLRDHERPLNKRGLRDAPLMGNLLKSKYPNIDLFITSHARRAHDTAVFISEAYQVAKSDLVIEHDLYHASDADFLYTMQSQPNQIQSIALFSHNPGITYFANRFTENYIDNVPTTGIVVLKSTSDIWASVNSSNTKLVDFLYPKKDLDIY